MKLPWCAGVGGGLENRLSSFLPTLQSLRTSAGSSSAMPEEEMGEEEEEKERPIPVYIPQPNGSSASSRRLSANRMLTQGDSEEDPFSMGGEEDEGGSTPLTDEPPTTPVMDEEPEEPPSPPPPPPPPLEKRKENPIDFLSRLISQSQKNGPQPSSTGNSFLANFSRLTSQIKSKAPTASNTAVEKVVEEEEAGNSPRPKCWAEWKAEKAEMAARVVVEPPNTSVPPPLIPGLIPGPLGTSMARLGLRPPPSLPLPSLPIITPPPVSLTLSLPPRPVVSVPPPLPSSSPLAPLMVRPPMSPLPSSSSPTSMVPLGIPPPPLGDRHPPPPLSSPSSLAPPHHPHPHSHPHSHPPPGMHHHPLPMVSMASMTCPPPTLSSQHASPIKSITVAGAPSAPPPSQHPPSSPISPRGLPVASPHSVVPSPSSPYFEHTSPGQKENWPQEGGMGGEDGGEEDMLHHHPPPGMDYPGVHLDMPFPPVGMRSRGSNSVLRELTPSTEEMEGPPPSSSASPPPPPQLPSSMSEGKGPVEEVSAIATLASSPSRGGPSFMDKLKQQKHPRGYLPSTYTPNPNLMTLTQGEEEDMDEDDEDDDDEEEEEEEEEKKNGATRIPVLSSVVRRVDPHEKRQHSHEKEHHRTRDRDSRYSSSRSSRRHSRENAHDGYSTSSGYGYRDRSRSHDYDNSVNPSEYSPYSDDPYDDRGFDMYSSSSSYGLSSSSRQKYGISQGSSHRSYRH